MRPRAAPRFRVPTPTASPGPDLLWWQGRGIPSLSVHRQRVALAVPVLLPSAQCSTLEPGHASRAWSCFMLLPATSSVPPVHTATAPLPPPHCPPPPSNRWGFAPRSRANTPFPPTNPPNPLSAAPTAGGVSERCSNIRPGVDGLGPGVAASARRGAGADQSVVQPLVAAGRLWRLGAVAQGQTSRSRESRKGLCRPSVATTGAGALVPTNKERAFSPPVAIAGGGAWCPATGRGPWCPPWQPQGGEGLGAPVTASAPTHGRKERVSQPPPPSRGNNEARRRASVSPTYHPVAMRRRPHGWRLSLRAADPAPLVWAGAWPRKRDPPPPAPPRHPATPHPTPDCTWVYICVRVRVARGGGGGFKSSASREKTREVARRREKPRHAPACA